MSFATLESIYAYYAYEPTAYRPERTDHSLCINLYAFSLYKLYTKNDPFSGKLAKLVMKVDPTYAKYAEKEFSFFLGRRDGTGSPFQKKPF